MKDTFYLPVHLFSPPIEISGYHGRKYRQRTPDEKLLFSSFSVRGIPLSFRKINASFLSSCSRFSRKPTNHRTWPLEWIFPCGSTVDFSRRVPNVVNFYFTHSKLRKQPFFAKHFLGKCQIPKSRGAKATLPPFLRPCLRMIRKYPVIWTFWLLTQCIENTMIYSSTSDEQLSHHNDKLLRHCQWRIKGGADWATARGPQHLGGPQSLSRKKA